MFDKKSEYALNKYDQDSIIYISTTMNIYAHATREAKRTSARLLDKVVGTA